ncbi:hypothetical protein [Brevundimonas lenta]|uniref:Uncharacterized protein n=1 Tax=Brevundimonas lenta TaxID=424796 RepID=A0A7W6NNB3_9CAUL|nr:hypothetical protein [Brevundimonas lenta]MBB4081274.1 hypothetical protein [Brevundimonas lenta]
MALWLGLLAAMAAGQAAEPPARPEVAVVVLTLDQVRQVQARHGRSTLDALGDERWGRFRFVDGPVEAERFATCEDEWADGGLDYCVRFYLTRAEVATGAPPTVVVVFDDQPAKAAVHRGAGEMRALCFGRGVTPSKAEAQDTWLWPDSVRMHGVNDWERDRDALAACIDAAAAEPFTGLREPDVD